MSSEYREEARAEVGSDRARDAGYLHLDDVLLPADFTAEQLHSALEAIGDVKIEAGEDVFYIKAEQPEAR